MQYVTDRRSRDQQLLLRSQRQQKITPSYMRTFQGLQWFVTSRDHKKVLKFYFHLIKALSTVKHYLMHLYTNVDQLPSLSKALHYTCKTLDIKGGCSSLSGNLRPKGFCSHWLRNAHHNLCPGHSWKDLQVTFLPDSMESCYFFGFLRTTQAPMGGEVF